jgi:hypothetical protein
MNDDEWTQTYAEISQALLVEAESYARLARQVREKPQLGRYADVVAGHVRDVYGYLAWWIAGKAEEADELSRDCRGAATDAVRFERIESGLLS